MRKSGMVLLSAMILWACLFLTGAGSIPSEEENVQVIALPRQFSQIPVFAGTEYLSQAYFDAETGIVYLPFEAACRAAGVSCRTELDLAEGSFTALGEGFSFLSRRGNDYIKINNRYVFSENDYLIIQGTVCFACPVMERALGLAAEEAADLSRVTLRPNGEGILSGGEDYYKTTYKYESVFWLSRIIHAEAEGECMGGKIGIGNVIMNRVKDPYFPNTIKDVIFDDAVAVQFPPAYNNALGIPPSEQSLIAAYLCLEGTSLVGESEFFVQPAKGDDSWFRQSLRYVCTWGGHDFYEG